MQAEGQKKSGAPPGANKIKGWRRLALWPAALFLRLWGRTWRIEISPEEQACLTGAIHSTVFILWHNRLLMAPELRRRFRGNRPVCGLVSASRDGAWLAAFFHLAKIETVRGSSSRRGSAAAKALVAKLKSGYDAALTPDGPRGPLYSFKPGAVLAARQAKARICLLSANCESAWRLRSWDGFYLPKPFSRIRIRLRFYPPDFPPKDLADEEAAARLRQDLLEITEDLSR